MTVIQMPEPGQALVARLREQIEARRYRQLRELLQEIT
jgi:hypothetical protein